MQPVIAVSLAILAVTWAARSSSAFVTGPVVSVRKHSVRQVARIAGAALEVRHPHGRTDRLTQEQRLMI